VQRSSLPNPQCFVLVPVSCSFVILGPNAPLLCELAKACQDHSLRITYAGGIATQAHIEHTKRAGAGVVDFTIGTALSIFGGHLSLDDVISACD
jgi:phosphoribosylformimino-5-aminoimidazole carboxamide ribonucleotide (ProFAR) isomerase